MPLPKPRSDLKIAILVPCYKRPEYTAKCIKALEEAQEYKNVSFYLVDDGSNDGTIDLLRNFNPRASGHYKHITGNKENQGLRNTLIDFIEWVKANDFDMMAKIDNDCLVPKNWLNDMLDIFEKSDVQILSPNLFPQDAAHRLGRKVEGLPYMPSSIVGGLWFMYTYLVKT